MNVDPSDPRRVRRARLQLLLVALAFLGTPLAATLWFLYGDKGHHGDTVNAGVLVDPPRPVAEAAALGLTDAWTLMVVAPTGCAAGCERTLATQRQVRLTFAKDMVRIRRVLVSGADADASRLAAAHPDLAVLALGSAEAARAAIAGLPGATVDGAAWLIDPMGNLMMAYDVDAAPQDIQKDLKRLLKNSETWMRR